MVANTSTVSRIPKDPKIETNCANARKGFSKILAGIVAKNQNEIQEYINARATQEKDDITEYEQKLVASIQEKLAILAQLAEDPKGRFTLLEKELIGKLKESLQDKIFHSKITGLSFQSKFNTQDEEIRGLIFYVAFLCVLKNPTMNFGGLGDHIPLGFDTLPLYPLGVNNSQHLAAILNEATERMHQANRD